MDLRNKDKECKACDREPCLLRNNYANYCTHLKHIRCRCLRPSAVCIYKAGVNALSFAIALSRGI